MSDKTGPDTDHLASRYEKLALKKTTLMSLAEEYAAWTLPYVFPQGDKGNMNAAMEMQLSKDSIGAMAVNHLSNKATTTLYTPQRIFFRLHLDAKMRKQIKETLAAQAGNDGSDALAASMLTVESELSDAEQEAQDYMDMVTYRPQAVNATKLLIITGNALMYHPPGRPVQVYSFRDYVVVRDLSGEWVEIITRESKAFATFKPEVQKQLREYNGFGKKEYDDESEVTIYTQIRLKDDGKFHARQMSDHVEIVNPAGAAVWPKATVPWIPLTWNLVRGEDYGRGLVADYSGAFHAINVLSGSLLNIAAIMGDIKFLVNPASMIDVPAMNASAPGSYHSGKKDDVTTIGLDKTQEAQFIISMIERYEKQIGAAFLLGSAVRRQAERVTAEEIRDDANELEVSNGGIYSRLAATWQQPTANIVLDQIGFDGAKHGIKPKIITGMDSLSRAGELDNIKLFMSDLAVLNGVPEDVRAVIDMRKYATVVGTNRQVEYQKFIKSQDQIAQEQAAAAQQQRDMVAQQEAAKAGGAVATAAGQAAMQGAQ